MSRTELLCLARRWHFANFAAIDLAATVTDVRSAGAVANALARQVATLRLLVQCCFYAVIGLAILFVVVVISMVAGMLTRYSLELDPLWQALGIAFDIALLVGTCALGLALAERRDFAAARLKLLQPVASSERCEAAFNYIDAGNPAVLAWRDLALSERGVLYAFDVCVMRDVHYACLAAEAAAEKQCRREAVDAQKQRRIEVVGRELYGIYNPARAAEACA